MKGTEVPNPRRSSACDCTCVLTRNRTLSCDSLMLGMRILFCSCPCKVRSRVSDALSQTLCNLSLAFLADFTLSDSTAPIRKLFSLANYTLLFVWIERQDYSIHMSYRYSSFILRAYLCWRHTANGHLAIIELAKNVSPRTKWPLATWSRFIRMRVFREVKNGDLSCSRTNRKCSSFAKKHLQRKSLKIFDLHPPLRRLVSFVARIIA